MDRLNRMLQAAQGMGMGSAAPGGVSQQAWPVKCRHCDHRLPIAILASCEASHR